MTKRSVQAFAGGIILATSVLAGAFYLSPQQKKETVQADKKITETEVNSYLDSKKMVSINQQDYQDFLKQKDKEVNNQTNDKKDNKTFKLKIKDGMSTADVSAILEKEGIIPSAEDFNDYVIDANYHKEIRAGEFKLKHGMSFKQIVKVLTH